MAKVFPRREPLNIRGPRRRERTLSISARKSSADYIPNGQQYAQIDSVCLGKLRFELSPERRPGCPCGTSQQVLFKLLPLFERLLIDDGRIPKVRPVKMRIFGMKACLSAVLSPKSTIAEALSTLSIVKRRRNCVSVQ
jgi:hypothetical protein